MHQCTLALAFIVIANVAIAEDATEEPPVRSVVSKAFGKNFERNAMLFSKTLGRLPPTPNNLLRDPTVQIELELTDKQLAEVVAAVDSTAKVSDILSVAGLDTGKKLANLQQGDATEASIFVLDQISKSQQQISETIKAALTDKQYDRLMQIHRQKLLLFGNRTQVGLSMGMKQEAAMVLNGLFVDVDRQIEKEIQAMKWRRYMTVIDEHAGAKSSTKSFGRPFYFNIQAKEKVRPNSRRSKTPR